MDFDEVLHAWSAIVGGGVPVEIRVTGGSMRPFVPPGSVLTVMPCDARALRRGDIVVARSASGRVVAHRLVASADGALTLRGDALAGSDEAIDPASVLGRAVRVRRGALSVDLDTRAARVVSGLLARAAPITRTANLMHAPVVRAVERLLATAPARYVRRPRRLDTAVLLAGPTEWPLLRNLALDAGNPACMPVPGAPGTVAVAVARGLAVGCAWRVEDRLMAVYVRPGWRRLGIGRTLLEVTVGDADTPVTAPSPTDKRSRALYAQLAFEPEPGGWVRGRS